VTRRTVEVRLLQVYYQSYFNFASLVFTIKLCVCPALLEISLAKLHLYLSNQLDITFSKFFHFIFATLHVSGVTYPSSGVSLLHW
jgi:hypothetical protein